MTEEGSAGKHPSCGAVFSCARVSSVRSTVSTKNSFGRYEWKGRSSGSGISALLLLPVCTPTVDVCEAELLLNGGGPAWSFTISLFSQMQECIRAPCHFLLLYHTESVKATALDKNDTTKAPDSIQESRVHSRFIKKLRATRITSCNLYRRYQCSS